MVELSREKKNSKLSRSKKNSSLYQDVINTNDFTYDQDNPLDSNSKNSSLNDEFISREEYQKQKKINNILGQDNEIYNTSNDVLIDNQAEEERIHNIHDIIKRAKSKKENISTDTMYRNTQYDILRKLNISDLENTKTFKKPRTDSEQIEELLDNINTNTKVESKQSKNDFSENSSLSELEKIINETRKRYLNNINLDERYEENAITSINELEIKDKKENEINEKLNINKYNFDDSYLDDSEDMSLTQKEKMIFEDFKREKNNVEIELKKELKKEPKKETKFDFLEDDKNDFEILNSIDFQTPVPFEELNYIEEAVKSNNRLIKILLGLLTVIVISIVIYFTYSTYL